MQKYRIAVVTGLLLVFINAAGRKNSCSRRFA